MTLRAVVLMLLCSAPALAQMTQEEAPVTEGVPKFTAPTLQKRVQAVYPPEAAKRGLQGTVLMEIELDEKGKVTAVNVKQGAGHGFDEAAVTAVKQFEFTPAYNDRTPVPSRVTYAYKFTITEVLVPKKPTTDETVRIKGGVFLRGTRTPLVGARVVAVSKDDQREYRATVGDDGQFELKGPPPGKYHLVVVGAKAKRYEVDETVGAEILTVNYYLEPNQYARYESVVRADLNREEVSRVQLTTEELVKMPGSMGDALRAVENLPGVARAPFNSGLIIVRGGKPTDSRVFLAGAEVPQLYHFGGLRSVYPTQLIDHIDYFPGNFGVRYGRGIAGIIDVDLRTPKNDRFHGAAEVNVFDAGILVEGPLKKGSFALAARRSYVDAILPALSLPGLQFTTAPVYYDYQAILDYPVGGGRLRLLVSGSDDQLKLVFDRPQDSDPSLSNFGTHIYYHKLQTRWTRQWGKWNFYIQNSTGVTGQSGQLGRALNFDVFSVGTDFRLEARYQLSKRFRLLAGIDTQYGHVYLNAKIPPPPREGQIPSPISANAASNVNDELDVFNLGAYLEGIWKPIDRLTLTTGLRVDYYSPLKRPSYDPRFTFRLNVAKYTWIKGGVGHFSQDPQPPDYNRAFGNPNVRPEKSIHYALTLEQGLAPGLMLEVTGFYKQLYDLVAPTEATILRDGQVAAERVATVGEGRVYGGELLLRQSVSKYFFGWVSYTLMRSERKDCASCAWRLFDFDQTHVLILALHAYLPKGFEIGARFRYVSGVPFTPAYGGWYDADSDVYSPARGPVNTARLDAFHQLDLRIDKTFLFKRWVLKAYLDIINVYNRANPELNQSSYDFTRNRPLTGLPIIPSFGIRGEF